MLELRKLIKNCDFDVLADNLLKVRIILGLHDSLLQERLLREPNISLARTIEVCRASETAKASQAIVNSSSQVDSIGIKKNQLGS